MEPSKHLLSVVMPCYNEEKSVKACIAAVLDSPYVGELIIVDDGSTDQTPVLLKEIDDIRVRVFLQGENQGKGAALRVGFQAASLDYVIVQDADLEYNPNDFEKLIAPLRANLADVVYGSRFMSGDARRVLYFWHSVGNKFLTLLSNMFTNLNLTDMETCYKCFRRELIQNLELKEDRFGIEPELTGRIAQTKVRVYEVGISYSGRTYEEGKKINWKDGLSAVRCIIRYSPLLLNRKSIS
jgi:glycosyltransferase involved in cell wall biosynthesis